MTAPVFGIQFYPGVLKFFRKTVADNASDGVQVFVADRKFGYGFLEVDFNDLFFPVLFYEKCVYQYFGGYCGTSRKISVDGVGSNIQIPYPQSLG